MQEPLKGIIPSTCKWLIIRDTDCVPLNKKIAASNDDTKDVDTSGAQISVLFQDGYGIESTFLSEPDKLARLLTNYYNLNIAEQPNIQAEIDRLINVFSYGVKDITSPIHKPWKKHFDRQLKVRSGRVYRNLKAEDVLSLIEPSSIQYIMTKELMNKFLNDIHSFIISNYATCTQQALTSQSIFTHYYSWITGLNDIFDAHKSILTQIYS